VIFTNLFLIAAMSSGEVNFDCGKHAEHLLIDKTSLLIVHPEPMEFPIGEMSSDGDALECVRLNFSIDSNGVPIDISIADSTKNIGVEMAAVRAVQKYRFRTEAFGRFRTYSLVFFVRSNRVIEWNGIDPGQG
jgi:TonB family protein